MFPSVSVSVSPAHFELHYVPCGLWFPFLSRVFPIELWDSLSAYVHPGIACLASQASVWLGALWASLSGL